MTDPADDKPEELNYRAPRDEPTRRIGGETIGCAFGTALLLVGAIAGLLFVAFNTDYRGFNQPFGVAGSVLAAGVGIAIFASLVITAIRWQRQPDKRELAIGIWIGIGLAALIEGMCFAYNIRR